MDKQNLMPQAAQPVNRIATGQLPVELAELSEEALQLHGDDTSIASVLASGFGCFVNWDEIVFKHLDGSHSCSYDGDDAE